MSIRSLGDILSCYDEFSNRLHDYTYIRIRGLPHRLRLRNRTSDFDVFRQVFLQRQYEFDDIAEARFIVDAGANIGLTSVFLLARYPEAQIIAIEPDPENLEVAAYNLLPFADRCHLVHGALWSENTELAIHRGNYRDGRHWATQTLPMNEVNGESVPAFELDSLLARFEFPQIDLLKIDIEGAELQVFRDGDTGFLQKTQCCAIELHDDACAAAFRAAIAPHAFETYESGELLIAKK